jgi:HAD superfamily hydrolase (TIGR01490 family)
VALAIFDLDNTLLAGDSDHMWGTFLCEHGIVDAAYYQQENDRFYDDYVEGTLDIYEFLRFALKPLRDNDLEQLKELRAKFMQERIEPIILAAGEALIDKHRHAGDTLLIITATNAFVTTPIAERLGIEHLLATEPEMVDGRYTGELEGIPCYQEGKVRRLRQWLWQHNANLKGSIFYSDSHNDIPLLETAEKAVAVDPDDALREYAAKQQWPIISLRGS